MECDLGISELKCVAFSILVSVVSLAPLFAVGASDIRQDFG